MRWIFCEKKKIKYFGFINKYCKHPLDSHKYIYFVNRNKKLSLFEGLSLFGDVCGAFCPRFPQPEHITSIRLSHAFTYNKSNWEKKIGNGRRARTIPRSIIARPFIDHPRNTSGKKYRRRPIFRLEPGPFLYR